MRGLWMGGLLLVGMLACANDTVVLYDRGGGGEGGIDPDPPPPTSGPGPTTGVGGAGGEPPPEVLFCEPMFEEPVCECPDGATCVCEAFDQEPCSVTCQEGCFVDCGAQSPFCSLDCGQGCQQVCSPGSFCTLDCNEGCQMICLPGAQCMLFALEGPSFLECDEGAFCECGTELCQCEGPGECVNTAMP